MDQTVETEKLWTGDFILVGVVNFLIMFIYYQITAILAVYAMNDLGATPSQAGLATGMLIVAALIARILTGKFIEEVGRKRTLCIGLAINFAAILLYFLTKGLPALFFIRILHGIGFGISTTAAITVVANVVPQARRGEGIGYFALSTTIASAVGPSLGIYLYQHSGFSRILVFAGLTAFAGCITALILKVGEVQLSEIHEENLKKLTLSNFFEVKVFPIAIIGFLVFFSYSSIIGFFSAYATSIELIEAGSLFFIVYAAATIISRPFTSRRFDRKGENSVLYPTFIVFAIGLLLLGLAQNGMTILVSGVFLGVGFGTFVPSGQTIAVNLVKSHRVGVASSTFLAISETGIGIGPFLLGFLVPVIGYRGLYFCLAGLLLVIFFLYYRLHGRYAALHSQS